MPYYVGHRIGEQGVGLNPNAHGRGITTPLAHCQVDDIGQSLQSLLDAGAEAQQEVSDVGGGKKIALLKDADGNVIGLMQES
jgi:predicted enzyme related to lactoylglutathione lyase